MKNRRALTFATALGALSFLLLYFYVSNIEERYLGKYERVSILVAKRDILRHESIDTSMLEKREVPKPYVQPLAATTKDLDQVVRYTASTTIKKGEQIFVNKNEPSR